MEHPGLPALSEAAHLALDDLEDRSESDAARQEAADTLRPHLEALCSALAPKLVGALEEAGRLEGGVPVSASGPRSFTQGRPLALLAYPTGRSLVAEALGAEMDGAVVEHLVQLAADFDAPADASALEKMVASAYQAETCTPALRHFRVALLQGFHPQVRASALSALDPDRAPLAMELALRIEDTSALLDAFDQARAEADIEAANMAPGPPRHFSWVHVAFAIIIVALSAYHYLFR